MWCKKTDQNDQTGQSRRSEALSFGTEGAKRCQMSTALEQLDSNGARKLDTPPTLRGVAHRLTEGKERDRWEAALTLYRLGVHARQLWQTGTLELPVRRAEAFAMADAVSTGDLRPVHTVVGQAADLFASPTVLVQDADRPVALAADVLAQVRQAAAGTCAPPSPQRY